MDAAGYSSYFGYDLAGNILRSQDTRGFNSYFGYDPFNLLTAVVSRENLLTYFGYDAIGNQVQSAVEVRPGLFVTSYFGYDPLSRLVQQCDALNRATYFEYSPGGKLLRFSAPGQIPIASYYGYDQFGRTVRALGPLELASYYSYDPNGNLTVSTNPRGYSTAIGYDRMDRMNRVQDALLQASYFAYDALGNRTRQVDNLGFSTYYTYDPLDRLIQLQDPLLNVTQISYDVAGNMNAVLSPIGGAAYYSYDLRNLLSVSMDGVGNSAYYQYDPGRNKTANVSPRGFASYYAYDAMGRLTAALDNALGSAYFGYDGFGDIVATLDPLSRSTYFGYDLLSRITSRQDAAGLAVYFGYDLSGNRVIEQDARGNATYFTFDAARRLTAILDPMGRTAYYGYDRNSNLTATLDAQGQLTYFYYDALDRRTSQESGLIGAAGYGNDPYGDSPYGDSAGGNFEYDADSRLVSLVDGWGNSTFGYDALSRIVKRITPRGDAVYYGYDGASNLLRLQYPQDGKACYYGYDDAQRLEKLRSTSNHSCYYTFDASSNVTKRTLGNSVISWASFDPAERMLSLRYAKNDGTALAYFDYGRDVAGRILRIERENGLAIYYNYDAIDRLDAEVWRRTSDNGQIYGFWYSYDEANNRLQVRRETSAGAELDSTYYSYAADNSLTQRQVQTPPSTLVDTYFGYDLNGSLTALCEGGATTYYGYNTNQLISRIKPPAGSPSYFYYDGNLSRYLIDKTGTLTYYLWDGLRQLEERDVSGNLLARYTHGNARQPGIGTVVEIERHVGAATYYQYGLADHRGTFYKVTDQDQNVQLEYTLDAFGRPLAEVGGADPNVPNDLQYQSNWLSLKIGGRWYGISPIRFYDSELGIFLQQDVLPAFNKYSAWSGNPVLQVDPDGLEDFGEGFERGSLEPFTSAGGSGCGRNCISQSPEALKKQRLNAISQLQAAQAAAASRGDIGLQNQIINQIQDLQKGVGSIQRAMDLAANGMGTRATETSYQIIQGTTDFVRGVGSSLTFGATDYLREVAWGKTDSQVIFHGAYVAGEYAGTALDIAITAGSLAAAKEAAKLGVKGTSFVGRQLIERFGAEGATQLVRKGLQAYSAYEVASGLYGAGTAGYRIYQGLTDPCKKVSYLDVLQFGASAFRVYGGAKALGELSGNVNASAIGGAETRLTYVYPPYPGKVGAFLEKFGVTQAKLARARIVVSPSIVKEGGATLTQYLSHERVHFSFATTYPTLARFKGIPGGFGVPFRYAEEVVAYSQGFGSAGRYSKVLATPIYAFASTAKDDPAGTVFALAVAYGLYETESK